MNENQTWVNIDHPRTRINNQALALMEYLKGQWHVGDHGDIYIQIESDFWYNGRERGISLTMRVGNTEPVLIITFGENRNSDSIFVDYWEDEIGINPPVVGQFTDEAYENRSYFKPWNFTPAKNYIVWLIKRFVAKRVKSPTSQEVSIRCST